MKSVHCEYRNLRVQDITLVQLCQTLVIAQGLYPLKLSPALVQGALTDGELSGRGPQVVHNAHFCHFPVSQQGTLYQRF